MSSREERHLANHQVEIPGEAFKILGVKKTDIDQLRPAKKIKEA